MASIRRRPGTKNFTACFTDASGNRVQRSTATADRKLAMKMANDFEAVATKRATEAQFRRVLSDLHDQVHGSPLTDFTLKTYADQWLGRKKSETRAVSYLAYSSAVSGFLTFCGEKASQPIAYVTPALVASWRDASAAKATPRTANNKLKIVRTLLQSAWRDGLLPDGNPAAKVEVLSSADSIRRPLGLDEIKTILATANTAWRGMVLTGLYTGQRLKDIAGLTWNNVDLVRSEIRLKTSKTGRSQHIPLAAPLRAYLLKLDAGDDPRAPIFPSLHAYATKANGSARLSTQFHEILVDAGLVTARPAKDKSQGKGRSGARSRSEISFHSLRHTATSLLKMAGVSEAVARDLIGHDSADVSANYTHTDDKARRDAVALLPDVTGN